MLVCLVINDRKAELAGFIVFVDFAHKRFFLNFAPKWTGLSV